MTIFLVSANHPVSADYCFSETLVLVSGDAARGFYAMHPKLGCGKTFRDIESAILHLFGDHACRVTAWRFAKDQRHALHVYRNGGAYHDADME